jgi:hypothetical protein
MTRLRLFFRLPWAERWLLLEASILVSLAEFAVCTLPFRWLARVAGTLQDETPAEEQPRHTTQVRRVRWAVQAATRYLPWQCRCLAQALSGQVLLAQYGIAGTLYLGVRRAEHGAPSAHAWLRSGTLYVTGGQGHRHFQVIATFAGKGT